MVTSGAPERLSAEVAVTVIRWRRPGVVSLTAILNASARTATDWLEPWLPFVAATTARYVPLGTNAPRSLRPFQANAYVPAASASPALIVLTVAPAALTIVQLTVAGLASVNEKVVVAAYLSPSCGKNGVFEALANPRELYTATIWV